VLILSARFPVLLGLGLLALLLAPYATGLHEGFLVVDDYSLIAVPQIRTANLFPALYAYSTPGAHIDFYPLRDLSYWVDVHLFGADVSGVDAYVFRLSNIFWLVVAAVGLAGAWRIDGISPADAGLWASFWALLPMHSELVMWPSARKDVMAIALVSLAAWASLSFFRSGRKGTAVLALGLFLASLLTKASAGLIPFALIGFLVCDRFRDPARRVPVRPFVAWTVALGALSGAVFSFVQSWFYSSVSDMRFFYDLEYRIRSAVTAFGRHISGVFYLGAHTVDVENSGAWYLFNAGYFPVGVGALAFSLAILIWALRAYRRGHSGGLVACWVFVAAYLPISALGFPHRNFYSVRYFELPLFVLVWFLVPAVQARVRKVCGPWRFSLLLIPLAATTQEAQHWSTSSGPFLKAYAFSPDNPSSARLLRDALSNEQRWGRLQPAETALLQRLRDQVWNLCNEIPVPGDGWRNGHLCLTEWLHQRLDGDLDLEQRGRVQKYISASLGKVQPKIRGILDLAQQNDEIEATGGTTLPKFPAVTLTTPEAHVRQWVLLCLEGDGAAARNLLRHKFATVRLDNEALALHVASWTQRRLSLRSRLESCGLLEGLRGFPAAP